MDLETITRTLGNSYSERTIGSSRYNLLQPFYNMIVVQKHKLWN